jgi:hypothetical protein
MMDENLSVENGAELTALRTRVATLEFGLARLQRFVLLKFGAGEDWVEQISGGMKDYPDLSEYWKQGRRIIEETGSVSDEVGG